MFRPEKSLSLDAIPENEFDDIVRLAAMACGTPLALLTVPDSRGCHRIKAQAASGGVETTGVGTLCWGSLCGAGFVEVPDTALDQRFRGAPGLRFYAGVPLCTSAGQALGTLAVCDAVPRRLTAKQREGLEALARQVQVRWELQRVRLDRDTLRASSGEDHLRVVADNVPALIARVDAQRRYVFANRAYQDRLAVPVEQVIGSTMAEVLGESAYASIRPYVDRVLAGEAVEYEARLEYRTVGKRLIHASYVPERDGQGRVIGFILSVMDVTERDQAALARAEAEARLSTAVANLPIIVWAVDADGIFTFSEGQGLAGLGLRPGQVVGLSAFDVFHDEPQVPAFLRQALSGERTVWAGETGGRAFDTHVRPLRDAAGRTTGVIGVSHDVTERRRAEEALQASEVRFRALAENGSDVINVLDGDGIIRYASPSVERLFGYRPAEAAGHRFSDFIHPDDLARVEAVLAEGLATPGLFVPVQFRCRHRDGSWRYLESVGNNLLHEPGVQGIIVSSRDISDRKEAAEALRHSEERLQLALQAGRMGTWELDYDTGTESVSNGLEELYGVSPGAFEGRFENFLKYVHRDDVPLILNLRTQEGLTDYEIEYRVLWPNGSVHWLSSKGRRFHDSDGRPRRITGAVMDITERKALEAERERLLVEALERADHCPLTGLLNHRAFHKRLEEEADRAQRDETSLLVAMMDLDNFKFFNDAYGHQAGDDVLRRVVSALQTCCRPYDTLARFGGDEFALLMPGVGPAEAPLVAARLRASLERLGYRPPGHDVDIPLSLTVGVAVFPDEAAARQDVVALADARLYRAKSGGDGADEAERLRARMSTSVEGFSMLDALVAAVDNKDRYTRRHSEDVMRHSLAIAGELGLDEPTRHALAVAALLHDVGKIGVPDAILRKPSRLTGEELVAMQQHPQMGAVIVQAVPGLEGTLDAIRHHHERWDGGGYPFGLCGAEIPFLARLMAVADAYSAMTTDRPYRKGMDAEKALSVLETGAGTQWDLDCVRAFLRAQEVAPAGTMP